jgi:hypothetical protein
MSDDTDYASLAYALNVNLSGLPSSANVGDVLQWTGTTWKTGRFNSGAASVVITINDTTTSLPAAPAVATYGQLYKKVGSSGLFWNTSTGGEVDLVNGSIIGSMAGTSNIFAGTTAATLAGGTQNAFLGVGSAAAITSGSSNVGVGQAALAGLTTGGTNTAVGRNAGSTLTTGAGNLLLGNGAQTTAATTSNQLVIGDATLETAIVSTTADVASGHRVSVKIGTTVYQLLAV